MKTLLKNVTLYANADELETNDVLITDKKITNISNEDIDSENIDNIIHCNGNLLVPGFIDVHIHLREPGGEQKETIKTEQALPPEEVSLRFVRCQIQTQFQTHLKK